MKPNFESYTAAELNESLRNLDKAIYPEREKEILDILKRRKEHGFVLSGETDDDSNRESTLSLTEIALPFWWRYTWRSTLLSLIASTAMLLIAWATLRLIGPTEYLEIAMVIFQLFSLPVIGVFVMRQTLAGKYQKFHLEVVPKTTEKTIG